MPDGLPARCGTGSEQTCFWVSDDPLFRVGGPWRGLYARRAESGMYPLLLQYTPGDEDGPWRSAARRASGAVDVPDAAAVLRRLGRRGAYMTGVDELAAPGGGCGDPDECACVLADAYSERGAWFLGLARAASGADALALSGWDGAANHTGTEDVTEVLRSWEGRFGARVVALGFAEVWVSVAAPPVTIEHARAVAAEHEAFCPDGIWQGPGDLDEYAEGLVGRRVWSFWWD
ncbi:hypothetical protein BJF79_24030 [Actinomadura sp. CNU-125]|nr:hypothetical protein BJF79_24030 [Actinomadura sp. CNU-125]